MRAGYSGVNDGWSCVLHEASERTIEGYKLQVPIVLSENEGGATARTTNKQKKINEERRQNLLFEGRRKVGREGKGKKEEPIKEKGRQNEHKA